MYRRSSLPPKLANPRLPPTDPPMSKLPADRGDPAPSDPVVQPPAVAAPWQPGRELLDHRGGSAPASCFAERRRRVAERMDPVSAIVLPGGVVQHSSRDSEYPFRPDSELYWATGIEEPEAVAVLLRRGADLEWQLFARERDETAELWTGPREAPQALAERLGAARGRGLSELPSALAELLAEVDTIYFRLGAHPRIESHIIEALQRARARGAREGTGPRRVVDPGELLDDLRMIKDAHEIERIRAAADLTLRGFEAGLAEVRAGAGEWQVQAALEAAFRHGGGDGPAFGTIVGAGANACVLHYVANRSRIGADQLVLVDAGASRGLYAGDVTRTVPVGGRFTAAGRAVYEAVEAARAAGVAVARPGATLSDVHDAATRVLVEFLIAERLLEGEAEERIAAGEHKAFAPHSTSHWLGLDVHDPGDYARAGAARRLEPGMVFTVEPGLYFGPAALAAGGARAERFAGIGVRIEDDLLVTRDGHENLTAALPTDPDELAARMLRA